MSRSRSAQVPSTQNQSLNTIQINYPPNYRAQATNQITNGENSKNYTNGQTGLLPQFHDGFIHIELGLDKNKKAEVPRSNQTMRQKKSRQIISHLSNPNHLIVLDVPQNHSNLLQVPSSNFGPEIDSYRLNHQTNRMIELQPEKVQVRSKDGNSFYKQEYKSDLLNLIQIDPSKAEKQIKERQKRSEKNTLKVKKSGRIHNSGVYMISVSESVSDNKGMDKAQPLSNHTKDSHNETSSVIVSEGVHEANHTSVLTPPLNGIVQSFIFKREKIFWKSFVNPEYTLNMKNGEFVLNSKKKYAHFNSFYSITTSQKQYSDEQQGYLGYLQGNFTGSQFNLYQQKNGRHELTATIYYVSQFSCSNSYRSIEVYLKHPLLNSLGNEKGSLRDLYCLEQNSNSRSIIKLVNKQPAWNTSINCYIMNFHGKSKLGSIKNMILVQEDNPRHEVMLFCKTDEHEFLLEIGNPLSPFVAMGVILSSFDFKLCCE